MKGLLAIPVLAAFCALPAYADLPGCDAVVKAASGQSSALRIQDEKKLTALLRTLNRDGVLPADYVTRDQAIKQGWSGKDSDSLWSVWSLNKKLLGGDPWTGKPAAQKGPWYSADLDSVRGLRSGKQLIYSRENATRYLTSDKGATFVTLAPCQ